MPLLDSTARCHWQPDQPDPACTPGETLPVTKEDVCQKGYAGQVRSVSPATKNAVYVEYGITSRGRGEYEVDHLISLELGGSNSIRNLWPQPAAPTPGFHQKDRVENYLHQQVCSGALSLREAQQLIVTQWKTVFASMSGTFTSSSLDAPVE
jgi:hypothetical protein